MLIHLDGSAVADAVSASATAARSHACVENLLLAHFEGNHVISIDPANAATLRAASPAWSDRARRALDHIDDNYAQIAGLRADVAWSLELGIGPSFDGKASNAGGGKKILRAPLHEFQKVNAAFCSALLGENETDADFFQQLGFLRRAQLRWDALEMIHDLHGGGGSTFAKGYKSFADQKRIVLAIADTDKRHPKDGGGGTYKDLEAEANGRPDYHRARPMVTRTAEGLVPLGIYREVFSSKPGDSRINSLSRLEQMLRSAPADILRYAHLKDGIRLYQVHYPKTPEEGAYWDGIAKSAKRNQCGRPTSEQCTTRQDCRCYVVDGLGVNALSDVVAWLKEKNRRSTWPRVSSSIHVPSSPSSRTKCWRGGSPFSHCSPSKLSGLPSAARPSRLSASGGRRRYGRPGSR